MITSPVVFLSAWPKVLVAGITLEAYPTTHRLTPDLEERLVFDWLFEGRVGVYVLLAAVAAALFYFGLQLRRRALFVAGGIAAALILVYFLLDRFVETDREQVQRKLIAMAEGVKARDADRIVTHVSTRFSGGRMNRAAIFEIHHRQAVSKTAQLRNC